MQDSQAGDSARSDKQTGRIALLSIVSTASILAVMTANECHGKLVAAHLVESYIPSLLFGITTWLWWVGIALILWNSANRWPAFMKLTPVAAVAHISAGCAVAFLHLILLQALVITERIHWVVWGHFYDRFNVINLYRLGGDLAIYGVVFGLSGLLFAQAQTRRAVLLKLEVERRLAEAQLKALQMQMEPHFLFNTLNAITSLVALGRNQEAMTTLGHLNTILRRTLQRRAAEKIPFNEELQVIESYLAIQKVRFAKRLEVRIDVAPEALQSLVPCFLLQPIVENAIQHGITPVETGGLVETLVRRKGDTLWMQVRDNGAGRSGGSSPGHGIGIQNIRDRLAYFYPEDHEFRARARLEGGFEVTIQIPFEQVLQ